MTATSSPDPARLAAAGGAAPVLVVDDEENLRHLLRVILEREGYAIVEAIDGRHALEVLDAQPEIRVVLSDIRMPRLDGMGLLKAVEGRGLRVVMMSAYGTTDTAVDALSRGAWDYISKPFRADEIRACVQRIMERDHLEAENLRLREAVEGRAAVPGFLGQSPEANAVLDIVRRAAGYPSTVLFTGESGTGKELLARALHDLSPRSHGPFVAVNCAAIPRELLESELFGHVRGAFTGAVRDHAGLFEQADKGTLLLDEIGDMPLELQTRLLRVLEESYVRRVGGSRDRAVDVRVVAATAADLDGAVANGRFREDLFYRLNVVRVKIPPLRARRSDIPLLADALVKRASKRLGRQVRGVGDAAVRALVAHDWPGNVRQLENALERAVLMSAGDRVTLADLPPEVRESTVGRVGVADDPDEELSIKRRSAALERALIVKALRRTGGNRSAAARLLEISYKALSYKIRDYGVEV